MNDFAELEQASQDLLQAKPVVLIDDTTLPGAVFLVTAAQFADTETLCFLINHGRGLITAAISPERTKELGLVPMTAAVYPNTFEFMLSVEARSGVSTGISASDRAQTLRTLATTEKPTIDLLTPGHIFPLRAKDGGVLSRSAPPDAAVDLMVISKLSPVATLCRCLNEHGEVLSPVTVPEIPELSALTSITISTLIRFRLAHEHVISKIAQAQIPVAGIGTFDVHCYRASIDGSEHLAFIKGKIASSDSSEPVLVRVQSSQRIADILGTRDTFSRHKIHQGLEQIYHSVRGVFVYIRTERLSPFAPPSPNPEEEQLPTASLKLRDYGIGAQILRELGVQKIRLLASSSREFAGLNAFQVEIVERVPLIVKNCCN